MPDESPLPGWQCVIEEGNVELARVMLENHGVHAEIIQVGSKSKDSPVSLWVREADYARASTLVQRMSDAMSNAPAGPPWRCESCHEENEPQFDICWNCNRDRATGTELVEEPPEVVEEVVEESTDRRVLRELEEAGADLSQPRSIAHFLYVPTNAIDAVTTSLEGYGYEVEEREADEDDAPHPVLIVARKNGLADENLIGQARRLFELLAGMYRGDYDGWEAAIEP